LNGNSLSFVFPFVAVEISDLDFKWPSYELIPRYCSSSQLCCHRFKSSVFTPGRLANSYQIERKKQTKRIEFSCRFLIMYNFDILGSYYLWRNFLKVSSNFCYTVMTFKTTIWNSIIMNVFISHFVKQDVYDTEYLILWCRCSFNWLWC